MADTVRTGSPQHLHDFTAMTPGELEDFLRGLHAGAMAAGADLNHRFDFSGVRRLVDVAGGSGGVSIALCRRHEAMRATVIDLPRVTPHTKTFLAEAGLTERVSVESQDVVAAPLGGAYDAAVLRAFLQVLGPADAAAAVRHVAAGLAPGGMMYIVGHILDDDRQTPASTAFFDLVFMNVYTAGRAHTEGEHRTWLADAGMTDVTLHTRPDNLRIVSARKP
jgi:cyclopropane fatty-acyl-phospholipid synthase-like methyltransferase